MAVALLVLAAGAPAQTAAPAPAGAPAAGGQRILRFRVPEFDAKGMKKSEIFGDVADVLPDNKIKITGLRIVLYEKDGVTVEGTVTAAECIFDRKDKRAFSNTAVSLERGPMVVTGKGLRWNSDGQSIEILNNVRVEMKGVKMWNKQEKP
jgi:hypothetical protein